MQYLFPICQSLRLRVIACWALFPPNSPVFPQNSRRVLSENIRRFFKNVRRIFQNSPCFCSICAVFFGLGIGATPQAFGSEGIPTFVGMTERTNGARLARNGAKPNEHGNESARDPPQAGSPHTTPLPKPVFFK